MIFGKEKRNKVDNKVDILNIQHKQIINIFLISPLYLKPQSNHYILYHKKLGPIQIKSKQY